eukprot:g18324.t1
MTTRVNFTSNTRATLAKTETLLTLLDTIDDYASSSSNVSLWLLDSGATSHMLQDQEILAHLHETSTSVQGAFGAAETAPHCSVAPLSYSNFEIQIGTAIFSPNLPANILSFSRLLRKGFRISSDFTRLTFPNQQGKPFHRRRYLKIQRLDSGLFFIIFRKRPAQKESCLLHYSYDDHCRSGHILPYRGICDFCAMSKGIRPKHNNQPRDLGALRFNDEAGADLCGPVAPAGLRGEKYSMTIVDRKTRLTEAVPLRQKSESHLGLDFWAQKHRPPRHIKTDNGGEFTGKKFVEKCAQLQTLRRTTSFYESQQNGGSEVANRITFAGARTLIAESGLPRTLWPQAIRYFCLCLNTMPRKVLGGSSSWFEAYGDHFNTSRLRRFGADCFYSEQSIAGRSKLEPRRRPGKFVGFHDFSNDYIVYDPELCRVFPRIRDVVFRDSSRREFRPIRKKRAVTFNCVVHQAEFLPHDKNSSFVGEREVSLQEGQAAVFPKHKCKLKAAPSSCPSSVSPSPRVPPPEIVAPGLVYLNIPTPKTVSSSSPDFCFATYDQQACKQQPPKCTEEDLIAYLRAENPDVEFTWNSLRDMAFLAETITWQAASAGKHGSAEDWKAAVQLERTGLDKKEFAVPLPESEWDTVPKADVLPLRLYLTIKEGGRKKCRCCVLGNRQRNAEAHYSPVARFSTLRILLSLAARKRWAIDQWDISNAYVNAPLKSPIYVSPPPQWRSKPGEVWLLKKALYGLKESGFRWYEYFKAFLLDHGWAQNPVEPCLFSKNGVYMLLYVDDLLLFGDQKAIDVEMSDILAAFDCKHIKAEQDARGVLHRQYLGLNIHQDPKRGVIRVSQESLVDKILCEFDMTDCTAVRTPAVDIRGEQQTSSTSSPDDLQKKTNKITTKNYRSLVGMAMYLAVATRYDIAYAVKELGKYSDKNGPREHAAGARLIRYLKGTRSQALVFRGDKPLEIDAVAKVSNAEDVLGFSDADWGNSEDRRSTSGILVYFGGNLIFWQSITQKSVALSSTEAEYYAISECSREILYYRNLLSEISKTCKIPDVKQSPTVIFEDNKSCIDLVGMTETTKKSKHIDIRYNFVKDLFQKGEIKVVHISTKQQLADILTKPLNANTFNYLKSMINS